MWPMSPQGRCIRRTCRSCVCAALIATAVPVVEIVFLRSDDRACAPRFEICQLPAITLADGPEPPPAQPLMTPWAVAGSSIASVGAGYRPEIDGRIKTT
jgi:hypothetical protein